MNTRYKPLIVILLAGILVPCISLNVHAQREHPAYLRALSDLRASRSFLERPDGAPLRGEERMADAKIDDAIAEIRKASIDDGKNIADHPPVDPHLPWGGHLRKSLELLNHAHQDCVQEEDNPRTRGLQARVIKHIDEAQRHVREAMAVAAR